jgi:regulatory protein YycH of two-component signal transduction system YycFG
MNKNHISTIITTLFVIIGVILFLLFVGFTMDFEKTQCLKEGGKWVTGVISGSYSYFCVPQ